MMNPCTIFKSCTIIKCYTIITSYTIIKSYAVIKSYTITKYNTRVSYNQVLYYNQVFTDVVIDARKQASSHVVVVVRRKEIAAFLPRHKAVAPDYAAPYLCARKRGERWQWFCSPARVWTYYLQPALSGMISILVSSCLPSNNVLSCLPSSNVLSLMFVVQQCAALVDLQHWSVLNTPRKKKRQKDQTKEPIHGRSTL